MDDLTALKLQIEWGVDEALEEAPVSRLRTSPPPSNPLPQVEGELANQTQQKPPAPLIVGRRGEAAHAPPALRATQAAAAASTLDQLRSTIASFDGCTLRDTASHLIFAEGDPAARLILIGEPPSADDDRSGQAFAGSAGDYLDRMLAAISLSRAQLLLAPLIPWRPPGDRPPSAAELAICLPFLHRLITIVAPRRLLIMGLLPARSLLPRTNVRRRPRGEWVDMPIPSTSLVLPALPTFSAGELMKAPTNRRPAWDDLRLLRRTLDEDAAVQT